MNLRRNMVHIKYIVIYIVIFLICFSLIKHNKLLFPGEYRDVALNKSLLSSKFRLFFKLNKRKKSHN
jgi:hypothetical protein